MTRRLCYVLALFWLVAAPARADSEPGALAFPEARQIVLENGLCLVAQPDRRQPLVAFVIAYEVGSRDDPPGYRGLAEWVERLTEQGSRHLGPYQLASELERVGALRVRGATGPDYTSFSALLPAHRLATAFWLESERMAFTLERFQRVDPEVVRARSRAAAAVAPSVDHQIERALFAEDHPYRPVEASELDGLEAPLSAAEWLFQAAYRPNNALVVAVGDFETADFEALASKYFGPIENPPVRLERHAPPVRRFTEHERLIVNRAQPASHDLAMVWALPLSGAPDEQAADVLVQLLRQRGMTSLEEHLERRTRLADEATISTIERDVASWLTLRARLSAGTRHEQVEASVARHLGSLGPELLTDRVVAAGREREKLRLIAALEDPLEHAELHLRALRTTGAPFRLAERLARIDAVTTSRVREVAARYLDPTRRLAIWYRTDGQDGVSAAARAQ